MTESSELYPQLDAAQLSRDVSICNDLMPGIRGSNELSVDGYFGIRIRERQAAGTQYNMTMNFDRSMKFSNELC